jgi:hypothetical protein
MNIRSVSTYQMHIGQREATQKAILPPRAIVGHQEIG